MSDSGLGSVSCAARQNLFNITWTGGLHLSCPDVGHPTAVSGHQPTFGVLRLSRFH